MSSISDAAFKMAFAEGQMQRAIECERRWRLREQEAAEERRIAQQEIARWGSVMIQLNRDISDATGVYTQRGLRQKR